MRRLASEAGTSTTAVYSLFGGKSGLVRELYIEGFRRLGDWLEQVQPTEDTLGDLRRLAHAYRQSALANRNYYSIMFGRAVPGFEPDEQAREYSQRSLLPLQSVVARGAREGMFGEHSAEEVTAAAWALVHGLVSLELNGTVPLSLDPDEFYERAVRNGMAGWTS